MNLQTPVQLPYNPIVGTSSTLYFEGSCFRENIFQKFHSLGFTAYQSGAGVLFNPISIEQNLANSLQGHHELNLVQHHDVWFSYAYSGKVFGYSEQEITQKIQEINAQQKQKIRQSSVVFITLGTAWVYVQKSSGQIVANCHKQPQSTFVKKLLSVQQIEASLQRIVELFFRVDPKLAVVFTISPVKHIKDGLVENARSKAHLLAAVQSIVESNENSHYFPSFEIVQEELRDYRFYAADLAHPNQLAIDYIWNRFKSSFCTEELQKELNQLEKLYASVHHKSLYEKSQQTIDFKTKLNQQIKVLPSFINQAVWKSYLL